MIRARTNRHDRNAPRPVPRKGLTVVAVIVCLVVLLMLAGVLLKVAATRRLVARELERKAQADWLAESGIGRALGRLAVDQAYKGETWNLTAADLDRPGSARDAKPAASVAIKVEPSGDQSRTITVRADFPPNPPDRVRRTRRLELDLKSLKGAVR